MGRPLRLLIGVASILLSLGALLVFWPEDEGASTLGGNENETGATSRIEHDESSEANVEFAKRETIDEKTESPKGELESVHEDHTSEVKEGSLLVRVTWKRNAEAASGIWVSLLRRGEADARRHARRLRTDEHGEVRFEDVAPGNVIVLTDRWVTERTEIASGVEGIVELELPPGITIEGRVVDGQKTAVPFAQIVISMSGANDDLAVATLADAQGRYVIRDLNKTTLFGARAEGYAPSKLHMFPVYDEETAEVELILGERGGGIAGHVFDDQARPLPGAIVQVGETIAEGYRQGDGGSWTCRVGSVQTRTDDEGQFRVGGFISGETEVFVRARGFAFWTSKVEIRQGVDASLEAYLSPDSKVRGTVVDGNSNPLKGVDVWCGDRWTLQGSTVSTSEDGRFLLGGLNPGEVTVTAEHERFGKASQTLSLYEGETGEIQIVLEGRTTLLGRLLDWKDQPVEGWHVSTQPDTSVEVKEYYHRFATSDGEGQFALENCADVAHRVTIQAPGSEVSSRVVEGVFPGTEPLVIRLKQSDQPSAFVEGRLVDHHGQPAPKVQVSISPQTRGMSSSGLKPAGKDGHFRFGPLPPTKFVLSCSSSDHPWQRFSIDEPLREAETRDLGDLVLEEGGRVEVRLSGEWTGEPRLLLLPDGERPGSTVLLDIKGDLARSTLVLPGAYVLSVGGDGVRRNRRSVDIVAGQTTNLDLVLATGETCMVIFAAEGVELRSVHVEVEDEKGELAVKETVWTRRREGKLEWSLTLGMGSYLVRATKDDLSWEGRVELPSSAPIEAVLR